MFLKHISILSLLNIYKDLFLAYKSLFIKQWYRKKLFTFSEVPTYITYDKKTKHSIRTAQSLSIIHTKIYINQSMWYELY